MEIKLEEFKDPAPIRPCLICGNYFEPGIVAATAYSNKGEATGRICPKCIGSGLEGIRQRSRKHLEKLQQWVQRRQKFQHYLETHEIVVPTLAEMEQQKKEIKTVY